LQSQKIHAPSVKSEVQDDTTESTEWLNVLLRQIADVYRSKIRDDQLGAKGDEVARRRLENYANAIRPIGFLDYIKVHSVDLGQSAPRLSNAQSRVLRSDSLVKENEFEVIYTDTISVSFSTSYLFNYPMPSFARLPVSLTISLSQFKSSISVIPPSPTSTIPVVTIKISQNFQLDITTTSLMGSRAKLANIPKLHELIQHQLRRLLAARGTWNIILPGLTSTAETHSEIEKDATMASIY